MWQLNADDTQNKKNKKKGLNSITLQKQTGIAHTVNQNYLANPTSAGVDRPLVH